MMSLHTNAQLFKSNIDQMSKSLGIPDVYIEKDYYVTMILKSLFEL